MVVVLHSMFSSENVLEVLGKYMCECLVCSTVLNFVLCIQVGILLGMRMSINTVPCVDVVVLAEVTVTTDIPNCYSKEIEHD